MALTQNCDIYLAIYDDGINRLVRQVFRQRPSIVNFATRALAADAARLCHKIDAHPIVALRHNPLVGVVPGLPILLTPYTVDYCFQITALELDVHPGNRFALPPELNPPLADQMLAVHAGACFGFGCPSSELVDRLPPLLEEQVERDVSNYASSKLSEGRPVKEPPPRPIPLPLGHLLCTCLDIFATAGVELDGPAGVEHLMGKLGGIEIVDITPTALEDSIECYLSSVIRLGLIPRLRVPIIQSGWLPSDLISIDIEPTPRSAALPNNPALEDDQIKVFLDVATAPGVPQPSSGGGGGSSAPPADPGTPRARTRTGPADATAALAERAVQALFAQVRDGFSKSSSGSTHLGPVTLSYSATMFLENGVIDMQPNGSIALNGLDVAFSTLNICVGYDIPAITIGGFCLIPTPFGCALHAPSFTLFAADPDIQGCVDIGPSVTIELGGELTPLTKYAVNPARTAAMNDWDAVDAGLPNHWQVLVGPDHLSVGGLNVANIVGSLLEGIVDSAIDNLPGPGWAKDFVKWIVGGAIDVIKAILNIGQDIAGWLLDKLGVLGLLQFIVDEVAQHLASKHPLIQIPDPLTLLKASNGLVEVLQPIEYLGIDVDADEMTVQVDLGG